mmetsp:Transcript_44621/g.117923  ORF Transcript_44621/g.117923 Transcript_44621/m.117923 type:complete len:178 (-) Transcript_44621:50-583(-)
MAPTMRALWVVGQLSLCSAMMNQALVDAGRRLLGFWKRSPFFCECPSRTGVFAAPAKNLDEQMLEIAGAGGVGSRYFPAELLLKSQLKVRGQASEKSVLDALRRLDEKESKMKAATKGRKDTGESGPKDDAVVAEDDDVSDEAFGDDDDIGKYMDHEDGGGSDFDPGEKDGDRDDRD